MKFLLALAMVSLLLPLLQGSRLKSDEDRLVSALMRDFLPVGRIARPEPRSGGNVTVTLGLSLLRVSMLAMDKAEIDVWISMNWNDRRLAWDPADFGGIKTVALPDDTVWLPDIRPYNCKEYKPDKEATSRVVVQSTASITSVLPASIKTRCRVVKERTLVCKMKLGSWVYSGDVLDLRTNRDVPFDTSMFEDSDQWEVTEATAKRVVTRYDCCPEAYVTIDYTLKLENKGVR